MSVDKLKILVVGATGSIGRKVVEMATEQGHFVRALVRRSNAARQFPSSAELVIGDLTRAETLHAALAGIDAIVFTHGSHGGAEGMEAIDYGGVRNVLRALGGQQVRIALMTSIGVTNRAGQYNQSTHGPDWKRRSERLVRASGLPYTIVRPGWFDYQDAGHDRLVMLQGDTRKTGTARDGAIARRQIAEVLIQSLSSPGALRKTFELVTEKGPTQKDFDAVFAPLSADREDSVDGVLDAANMPLSGEPDRVVADLQAMKEEFRRASSRSST